MADHRAIAVVQAFTDLIKGQPIVGDNVFKGRTYDLANTPSHSLYLGAALVAENNIAFIDQTQLIRDEVVVAGGTEDELDAMLMNVHAEAYRAVMADRQLGLSAYVRDTVLESMSEPDYIDEGARPILTAIFTWRVEYRHSITDPSA